MAEFLTTADMSAEVERVVKRAQHRVRDREPLPQNP